MTRPIPKKLLNTSPLVSLLLSKGYTLPDLKCEVSLMFCSVLFDLFLLSKEENKNHALIENSIDEEEYIFKKVSYFNEQIKATVVNIETVESNLKKDTNKSFQSSLIAKINLPYKHLYNEIIKAYYSKKDTFIKEDEEGKKFWMPELLAIHIIINMKERGYAYNKFPFIKEENFLDLIDRYIATNRTLQQTQNYKIKSKNLDELSIISKTRLFAEFISKKLIETKIK